LVTTVLDGAGFIPVVGGIADLANAGWYAAKGDKVNAALSAASAIPFAGDAFAAVKIGAKATGAVAGAAAVSRVSQAGSIPARSGVSRVSQAGSTPVQRPTSGSTRLRDERGRFAANPNSPSTQTPKHKSFEYQRARADLKNRTIDDHKAPKFIREWLKQERRVRGDDPRRWRNPPGYDTGHSDPNDNTRLRWETSSQNRSRGARFGR
jgi:hypothetical protein